jgi:hypothetical protein
MTQFLLKLHRLLQGVSFVKVRQMQKLKPLEVFVWFLTREPRSSEVERLVELYEETCTQYRVQPGAAIAMATKPLGPLPEEILKHFDGNTSEAHIHLAAWTVVGKCIIES